MAQTQRKFLGGIIPPKTLPFFYQAIGELYAALVITPSGNLVLDTQEYQYQAIVPEKVENRYKKLSLGLFTGGYIHKFKINIYFFK